LPGPERDPQKCERFCGQIALQIRGDDPAYPFRTEVRKGQGLATLRALTGAVFVALILTACATPKPTRLPAHTPAPKPAPQRPQPAPAPPPRAEPEPPADALMRVADLPHWAQDDHQAAFSAFIAGCSAAKAPAMARVCRNARAIGPLQEDDARRFFEANFRAERSPPAGILTAYFAPIYEARRSPDAEFSAAVRPKPADLKLAGGQPMQDLGNGRLVPYPDRMAIEARPVDKALAWMRPEELFFLQIQGSGLLTFEDGTQMKVLYAANNGQPFVGIANPMRDKGYLAANNTSGDAIRNWLAAHRGPDADAVMRINPRYAFFNLVADDGREPAGAGGVALPGGRSIAVDPAYHSYGELHWIDAEAPILAGAFPSYRRLVMALDTGGAIKGQVRADLYVGSGPIAGAEAGRVRHTLRMYRLIPKDDTP
jgi:membrane-bound lytic murein transglycosylase A